MGGGNLLQTALFPIANNCGKKEHERQMNLMVPLKSSSGSALMIEEYFFEKAFLYLKTFVDLSIANGLLQICFLPANEAKKDVE